MKGGARQSLVPAQVKDLRKKSLSFKLAQVKRGVMFPIDADVRQCRQAGRGINTATFLRRPEAMENL